MDGSGWSGRRGWRGSLGVDIEWCIDVHVCRRLVCKTTWKETQPTCIYGIGEARVGMLVDFHTHNLIPNANAPPRFCAPQTNAWRCSLPASIIRKRKGALLSSTSAPSKPSGPQFQSTPSTPSAAAHQPSPAQAPYYTRPDPDPDPSHSSPQTKGAQEPAAHYTASRAASAASGPTIADPGHPPAAGCS